MRSGPFILCIFLWVFLTPLCSVAADELHLSNGDIITGQLIRMEKNNLFFKTDYADEIKINWSKVINLITDKPVKVVRADGTVI